VWRFTTRGVDHFEFNPVPSPQVVSQPFPVTLTARDELDRTVTNFTGAVSLAGFSGIATPVLFGDNFEDGNISDWTMLAGNYTRVVTNSTAAGGVRSLTLIGGEQNHYDGVSHALPNIQPARVQFHVRASANNVYSGYFVVGSGDDFDQTAVFFYMTSAGTMGISSVNNTAPYVAGQWYRITFLFDWLEREVAFLVDGNLVATNVPFRNNVSSLGTVHLYNFDASQAWWDEIQFLSDSDVRPGRYVLVAVTDTGSGIAP
jgi:hypothetical protein